MQAASLGTVDVWDLSGEISLQIEEAVVVPDLLSLFRGARIAAAKGALEEGTGHNADLQVDALDLIGQVRLDDMPGSGKSQRS